MRWQYQPALDGVRAFAMYLIIPFHAGMYTVGNAFIALDIFFVLSGFLITNVMLSEIETKGRLDLGRFYARRVRRLLPAAVVVIVATAMVFTMISTVVRRISLIGDAQSALLYVANWRFLIQDKDYFATDVERSPYLHFWSLALEEQFYFVYPLLLIGLLVLSRRHRWVLPAGITLLALASVTAQSYWMRADPSHAYYGTDARMYQLLAGALLALLLLTRHGRHWPAWTAPAGVLGLLLLAVRLIDVNSSVRNMLATVCSVMLVGGLAAGVSTLTGRVFASRIPVYLGTISYGTYLWHWPVLLVMMEFAEARPWALAVAAAVMSTALAALSADLLENPIRYAERLNGIRWRVVGTGVVTSATLAVLVIPPVLELERSPAVVPSASTTLDTSTDEDDREIPDGLDWAAISQDTGDNHACPEVRDLEDCHVVAGGGLRVLLVGDSKARMLEPAFRRLAEERGLDLWVNVQPGCPWQAGLRNGRRPPDEQRRCIASRGRWYSRSLPRIAPDIVVLVSNSYDNPRRHGRYFTRTGDGTAVESHAELILDTTQETLEQITRTGARAVVIRDIWETGDVEPLDCLAAAKRESQCVIAAPTTPRPSDGYYQVAAATRPEVYLADINPVICPDAPRCRPIQDGLVVWRDHNHITAELGVELRDRIWDRIEESEALDGL